jgi:hypothetical protein
LEAQNTLLKAENEIAKKDRHNGKEAKEKEVKLTAEQKFLLVHDVIEK